MFFWVLATPICSRILDKSSLVLRFTFLTLIFSVIYYFAGFLNFWITLIPMMCVEVSFLFRAHKKIAKNIVYQFIALSLCILIHLLILIIFDSLFREVLDAQMNGWFERIDLYWKSTMEQMGRETKSYELLSQGWRGYLIYLPAVYFGGFIVGAYGSLWGSSILARFRCPESLFWISLLSFSFGFLSWNSAFTALNIPEIYLIEFKSYQVYFKNLFLVLSCLYFFQGLSVSSHLMKTFKIARFWQNLWYILVVFNLPMIFVLLGLIDFIFEFRTFKEKK